MHMMLMPRFIYVGFLCDETFWCCSVAQSCLTICHTVAHQAALSFTISWSLLKLMPIELMMLSNHLILCLPIRLLPSVFPSIRVFSNESALLIRWAKYCISIASVVFPINIQSWFPLGLTGWISLLSKRHSRVFSSTTVWKRQFSLPYGPTLTSIRAYWKNHSFDYMDIWDILLP